MLLNWASYNEVSTLCSTLRKYNSGHTFQSYVKVHIQGAGGVNITVGEYVHFKTLIFFF